MDMWQAFENGARRMVPGAEIVHDKFHIAKHHNDGVNRVCMEEHRHLLLEVAEEDERGERGMGRRTRGSGMIAFAHYSSEQDISGVSTWLLELMRYLRGKGEEVCLNLHHLGRDPAQGTLLAPALAMGVHVVARKAPKGIEAAVRDDLAFLNRFQPAVFLPQCLVAHFFAARLAARSGLPCALVLHSDDPEYWALAEGCDFPPDRARWVAVSEAIHAEFLDKRPGARCHVIPYGVSVPGEACAWEPRRFRVVYSGRIVEGQKRISLVLSTLMRFCQACPQGEALIIGDGSQLDKLRTRVAEAGLEERIRFTGRLAPEEVGGALSGGQAILLMSEFEGLPVALLEGMARGLVPAACPMRSGIPELVRHGETGLLLSEDPDRAAAALCELAGNGEEWTRLSGGARALVERSYERRGSFDAWWALLGELREGGAAGYPLPVPRRPELPAFDVRLCYHDSRRPSDVRLGVTKVAGYVMRRLARAGRPGSAGGSDVS